MALAEWHEASPHAAAAVAATSGPSACVAGGDASDKKAVAIAQLPSIALDLLMDLTYRRAATQELMLSTAASGCLSGTAARAIPFETDKVESPPEMVAGRSPLGMAALRVPLDSAAGAFLLDSAVGASALETDAGSEALQPVALLNLDASRVGLLLQLRSEISTLFEPIAALLAPPPDVDADCRSVLQLDCARLEANFHPEGWLKVGRRKEGGRKVSQLHQEVAEGLDGCYPRLTDEAILLTLASISFCMRDDREPSLSLVVGHLTLAGSAGDDATLLPIIASTDAPEWSRAFLAVPEDDTPRATGGAQGSSSHGLPQQQASFVLSLERGGSGDGALSLLAVTLQPLRLAVDAHAVHALQRQMEEWAHARWMATTAAAPSSPPMMLAMQQRMQCADAPATPGAFGIAGDGASAAPRQLLQLQLSPLPIEFWLLFEPEFAAPAARFGLCSRATLSLRLLALPRKYQLATDLYHVATTFGTVSEGDMHVCGRDGSQSGVSLGSSPGWRGSRGCCGDAADGSVCGISASGSNGAKHTEPLLEKLHMVLHMMLPRGMPLVSSDADSTAVMQPCMPSGRLPGYRKGLLTSGVGLSADEALEAEWLELELLSSLELQTSTAQLSLLGRLIDSFTFPAKAATATDLRSSRVPATSARASHRGQALSARVTAAAPSARRATVEFRAPFGVVVTLYAAPCSGSPPLALLHLGALGLSASRPSPSSPVPVSVLLIRATLSHSHPRLADACPCPTSGPWPFGKLTRPLNRRSSPCRRAITLRRRCVLL